MLHFQVHLHLRSGRKSRTVKWSNWVERYSLIFSTSRHFGWKLFHYLNVYVISNRPLRKHHTPLSVAKPTLKNQKKRELKKIEEVFYCLSVALFIQDTQVVNLEFYAGKATWDFQEARQEQQSSEDQTRGPSSQGHGRTLQEWYT